jgi:type III restriction enzyme
VAAFSSEDLVLSVRTDADPRLLQLDRYEAFLDALCADREYQKEAIRTTCRFLAGGQYPTTQALVEDNYANNAILGSRYGSLENLIGLLPFPDKLAASVDLATGTGKSYVMYGIARILLAEGVVDRVLVLCPSVTIESGLTAKFKSLSADARLLALIPDDAHVRVPEIKDANVTTMPGDICVENIAATYAHVGSSVRESFLGRGATALVLNDEAHHIYSPPVGDRVLKRWREFLNSPDFGFRRIVGFSGTCYVGNEYFPDVISRYSLRQAMEDKQVKQVLYVAKDESTGQDERFQKYLALHRENQARYHQLKPLSILITSRVSGAEDLADQFTKFLAREMGTSLGECEKLVLVVSSKDAHRANIAHLARVDRTDDPVEWIFSVSMLTEGWDVANVFQIVPHEKRAFASKLLIAQVLGRGLRVPKGLSYPTVRVFNHSAWSPEIIGLVDEVLEQERRLYSYPVSGGEHGARHFEIHQLAYETVTKEQTVAPQNGNGNVNLFTRGYVSFESQPSELVRTTTFVDALTQRERLLKTNVHYEAYSVSDAILRLHARLKSLDAEGGTSYAQVYPRRRLRAILEASLERIGERRGLVSANNLQHFFRAMGNARRENVRTVRIELKPLGLTTISTASMGRRSVALSSLAKEATVFYDIESLTSSDEEDRNLLKVIEDPESTLPRRAARKVANLFDFRSPVNVVLASHEPERSFISRLFEPSVADKMSGWVKCPDSGFYEIAFAWRKGDHTKQGRFNPDLFVRLANERDVLVVELKDDGDDSDETKAKLRFATGHFDRINALQRGVKYHVKFLSPLSYDSFFGAVRNGIAPSYISQLQAQLQN